MDLKVVDLRMGLLHGPTGFYAGFWVCGMTLKSEVGYSIRQQSPKRVRAADSRLKLEHKHCSWPNSPHAARQCLMSTGQNNSNTRQDPATMHFNRGQLVHANS